MTTTSPLTQAKDLVNALSTARTNVEDFFAPILADYIEFTEEIGYSYDKRDLKADTFDEYDNGFFYFNGEEIYQYGDYYTPSLSIREDFVHDPEAYKAKARQEQATMEARAAKLKEDQAKARVETLRKQLAAAEAALETANEQGDDIKTTATTNQIDKLKDKV